MEQKYNRTILAVCIALTTFWACFLPHMLRGTNIDITAFYRPWYEHILTHGRFASLEGSYANYSPPYLYLLSFTSLLRLPTIYALKLAQLPGLIGSGILAWSIAKKLGVSRVRAALCGWLVAVSPEAVINALWWGQCDLLYSMWLLVMIRLFLSRKWAWAMCAFGVALSFKLQALFMAPVLVSMAIAGELPAASALWSTAAYICMMVPAWLAGRPLSSLFSVYAKQFGTDNRIAWNVANPYAPFNHFVGEHANRMLIVDRAGLVLGAVLAGTFSLWLAKRRDVSGTRLIASSAFCMILLPFILPKMHDRYFFFGNLLLVLLSVINPHYIVPAVIAQISSLWVYELFFTQTSDFRPHDYLIPAALMSLALVATFRNLYGTAFNVRLAGATL